MINKIFWSLSAKNVHILQRWLKLKISLVLLKKAKEMN